MDLPKPLIAVIAGCLDEDPARRLQFQDLYEILEKGGKFSEKTENVDRDFDGDNMQVADSYVVAVDESDIFSDDGVVNLKNLKSNALTELT
jgi:hypothetical protein